MIFFVNLQVSDPYRRTDFTLELKILIFIHREMKFDLHIGLKMENATCAYLHLASTSSSVPPVVVTRLPRYVKADTCSRTSPTQLTWLVFAGDRILIWKRRGLSKHPWRTPVFILKDPVISPSYKTLALKPS